MNKFIVIAIVVVILIVILLASNKEKFYPYIGYKTYCTECESKNGINCGKCNNCVKCLNSSGVSTCVAGDINGPYFAADCVDWKYGNDTDYTPVVINEVVPAFSYFDWVNPFWWYGRRNGDGYYNRSYSGSGRRPHPRPPGPRPPGPIPRPPSPRSGAPSPRSGIRIPRGGRR